MNKEAVSTNLLFVYGTLKRDGRNHRLMLDNGCEFMTEVRTREKFPLTISGIPFLHKEPGTGHHVRGELFAVTTKEAWQKLDRLEGCPHLYKRQLVSVEDGSGNTVRAWAYFYQGGRSFREELHEEYACPLPRYLAEKKK